MGFCSRIIDTEMSEIGFQLLGSNFNAAGSKIYRLHYKLPLSKIHLDFFSKLKNHKPQKGNIKYPPIVNSCLKNGTFVQNVIMENLFLLLEHKFCFVN